MQQRVLLGVGAAALAVAAFFALRGGARHEAAKVTDDNIAQLLANLPAGYQIAHGTVDYNPLTATATVHDVRIVRDGHVNWTAETVTVAGADGHALRDIFDPAAYPAGKPAWSDRRLLIADLAAHNIHASVQGEKKLDYSIRDFTLHRLSGRPFAMPPTQENRARPEFAADAALALAADSVENHDIKLDDPTDNSTRMEIASLEADNYNGGKLASFALKDLRLDAKDKKNNPLHFTLASASLKDADARAVLQTIQQTGKSDFASVAKATYSAADIGAFDLAAANSVVVQWQSLHAEQSIPDSDGVREGRATLHAMTISLGTTPLPAKIGAAMDAFGMRTLTMDIDGAGRTKPGVHSDVNETITLKDLGTLRIQAAFSGYAPTSTTASASAAALLATTLESAKLVWNDASLTDRIFKVAAAQANTTPELIRSQLAMPVLAAGVMVPDQPDLADQLTAFLDHPHTLTITLNPPQKRTFGEITALPATERAHALGVHVTGN